MKAWKVEEVPLAGQGKVPGMRLLKWLVVWSEIKKDLNKTENSKAYTSLSFPFSCSGTSVFPK